MAELSINGRIFNVELVVFDKDGVLVDFSVLWNRRSQAAVEALVQWSGGDQKLQDALYRHLGYDPDTERVVGDSPLACATNDELYGIAASVLCQQGRGRSEAECLVQGSFTKVMGARPDPSEIRPLGDLSRIFAQLERAGVCIALVTSDDRVSTTATLKLLEVDQFVTFLVCGDDEIPNKPAPEAMWYIGRQTGVDPADMMVVGDTIADLLMGAAAGAGCRVGVLGGAGDPTALMAYADVLVDSIDEISVLASQ